VEDVVLIVCAERPYEPYFDMPNYHLIGRGLLGFARVHLEDDIPPSPPSPTIEQQTIETLAAEVGAHISQS
jgi:hypothetical protein